LQQDIIDRKQAEAALKESDIQLRLLIENSRDMISRHQPDGKVVFVSPACQTLLGYSPAEIMGAGANDFVHPDDIDGVWAIIHTALEGEHDSYRVEHRMRRKSREYIWIETIGRLLYTSTGELAEIQCAVRNINDRKRAEELLRIQRDLALALSAESEMKAVADRLLEHLIRIEELDCGGIYLVDEDTGVLDLVAHKGLPRQFVESAAHYEADAPQTRLVMTGNPIYRSYAEALPETQNRVRRQEGLQATAIIPILFEGQVIAALNLASHTYNEIPIPVRNALETMATTHIGEVLARIKAETALQALNAELEQRVKQRTAAFEAANRELKDFAYVVSHDLKAPLRGISRLANWLSTDYADVIDDEGREMAALLINRVKRMDNLIEGILRYSRIGRLEESPEVIDLNALVNEALDLLNPPENITIRLDPDFPTIVAERTRMFQVFQNLIGNAIKFMGKPHGEIRVQCEDNGSSWMFKITDNGPGIEERFQERIFQIFQTLHPRDEVESTGIGLALVKKIVELHGGTIGVESEFGKGATFWFTFPKQPATV
jgi:PAS domain S-box-containing protein